MIIKLFILSVKESFRSRFKNKKIIINILIGLLTLYLIASFAFLGFAIPEIILEKTPDIKPLTLINSYMVAYFGADLFSRFMIQSLPVVSIKPLMPLPINKSTIVNYLLIKSKLSVFNLFPFVIFIPLAINLTYHGYDSSEILMWFITVSLIVMVNNFLNLIIKRLFNDNIKVLIPALVLFVIIYALDHYGVLSLKQYFGIFLDNTLTKSYLLLIPLVLVFVLYYINYVYLISKLTLDDTVKSKTEVASSSMDWADIFGEIAPYIKLDLKMLWRNKRSRTIIYMSFGFLLYGLIFYTNPIYKDSYVMLIFVGIFITGIFSVNYGQFIPAWDSAHYSMLMTQRTNLLTYVRSKYAVMAFSVVLFFILSTPYVYFGWKIILIHLAGAIYNIGINVSLLLFLSSYNNKPIDLTQSAMMNYQGVGVKQWLVVFPLLGLPALLFWIAESFFGFYAGIGTLTFFGLVGIIFHQNLIYLVAQQLADRKYDIIAAFSEK